MAQPSLACATVVTSRPWRARLSSVRTIASPIGTPIPSLCVLPVLRPSDVVIGKANASNFSA